MQTETRKIKHVPCSIVAWKNKQTSKIKKLGLLHSKHISSLNMDLWGDDFLKKYIKSLQSKPLRKLTYSSFHTSNQEMLLLATMLRKLGYKTLEKLDFLFQETEMPRDGNVKVISKNVRYLSKLTSLDFQLYNFYNFRGTLLAPLKQSFRLLPSLAHLKIQTELCDWMNEDGLKCMINSLDGLNPQKIQSLYFDLNRLRKDLSEFLPELMRKIENFQQLRNLGLNLRENPIRLEAFRESMSVITKLKNLEEVSFIGTNPLTSEEYQVFMEAIGTNPNIKRIETRLEDLKRPEFEALTTSLGQLNNLEKLKLNLKLPSSATRYKDEEAPEVVDPTVLDDECFGKLALGMSKHAKTLKMFNFSLDTWMRDAIPLLLTSKGYGQIGKGLEDCLNIEDLRLMYKNSLESEDLVKNFQAIQSMKKLKTLELDIKASGAINADVVTALKSAFGSIKNVEKIDLVLTK